MNKKRRLVLAMRVIGISFLIYWLIQFGSSIFSSIMDFKAEITSKAFKTPAIDHSYDTLFKKEQLTNRLTYYIKGKEPLSTYTYNKDISVVILEMQGSFSQPINDVVSIHEKSTDWSKNVTYNTTFNTKLVEIARISATHQKATKLNLNLYGDSLSLQKKAEQMLYYRLKLDNMSISYGTSKLISFHMEKKGIFSSKPEIELMLKKQGGKIYLILALPKTKDVVIPKNVLFSLLK